MQPANFWILATGSCYKNAEWVEFNLSVSWIQSKGLPDCDFSLRSPSCWDITFLLSICGVLFSEASFSFALTEMWQYYFPAACKHLKEIFLYIPSFTPSANIRQVSSRHSTFRSPHWGMGVSSLMLCTKHPNQILQYLWIHDGIISNFFTSYWAGWAED